MSNLKEELSLYSLATFIVLDHNLPTPFRCIKVLQKPIIFPSNISIDIRDIYLSLNAIRVRLHLFRCNKSHQRTHHIPIKH
jgi:hypothetical protein